MRPTPVCTSSTIRHRSFSSQRARTSCTNRGSRATTPPLALHQLQHDGAGVGVHQLGQAVDVPGGGVDEPLVEGPEVLVEAVLPGGGQGGQGAPVEAVDQGDDGAAALAVVVKAVFTGGLDGALVGLGPRVGKEYLAHAGAAAQGLGQLGAGSSVVEVGGVLQLVGLAGDGLGPLQIAVAQAVDPDAAGEVQIVLAFGAVGVEAVAFFR